MHMRGASHDDLLALASRLQMILCAGVRSFAGYARDRATQYGKDRTQDGLERRMDLDFRVARMNVDLYRLSGERLGDRRPVQTAVRAPAHGQDRHLASRCIQEGRARSG